MLVVVVLSLLLPLCTAANVVVQTKNGKLRGVRTEHSGNAYVDEYKGIPYALPPTGTRRFKAPVPATPWSGERDATHFGSSCPKFNSHNEDCLYLNVYSWKAKGKTTPPLPVMVFIHGGSYKMGAGSQHGGTALALHSIVVVTLNYRLGALGFLSTEDDASPGNYGMLDQVLALKWVRDNIADFGGDPHHVTIFGESAGSTSISLHLLSPLSKGLFHAAVMQSGVSLSEWAVKTNGDNPSPLEQTKSLGHSVGCSQTNTAQLMECLKRVDVQKLVTAQEKIKNAPGRLQWAPVIENVTGFLPEHPQVLINKGMLMDIPTIRGVNKDEFAFFMASFVSGVSHGVSLSTAKYMINQFVQDRYGSNYAIDTALEDVYLKNVDPSDHAAIRTRLIKFYTDIEYYIPALKESDSQAEKNNSPVYMYEFDYRSPKSHFAVWKGVPHTAELPYVFGVPLQGGHNWMESDKTVSTRVMGYITNFAKHGNPSYGGVTWEPFTLKQKSYLSVGSTSVMKTNPRPVEEILWLETVPRLAKTKSPIVGALVYREYGEKSSHLYRYSGFA